MKYKSRGTLPVSYEYNSKHKRQVMIEGKKEFFMYGFIPNNQEIFIDEEAYHHGISAISKIEIEDSISFKNMMIALFTLGFYTPRNYKITGFSLE